MRLFAWRRSWLELGVGASMKVFVACLILACCCASAFGQATETVLYSFGAYDGDGLFPSGGLTVDAAGNLYGVTNGGGANCEDEGGCGTVYELSSAIDGRWSETILYNFCTTGNPLTCTDGAVPLGGLIMDASGNLYGTAASGGISESGVVFQLAPPSGGSGNWTETVLWSFKSNDQNNGWGPGPGKLNMDSVGNIYGTTHGGGKKNLGVVYELSPVGDGSYSFSILHSFSGRDGESPQYGVARDNAGNLYGTTPFGGKTSPNCTSGDGSCGVVYELTQSNGVWSESVLYKFNGVTGKYPQTPISIGKDGSLYGTFSGGGQGDCAFETCGGVFKLTRGAEGGKKYTFYFNDGSGFGAPTTGLLLGTNGAIYGTVNDGEKGAGGVFVLRGKTETTLYKFCSQPGCMDGRIPSLGTLIGRSGVLYGNTLEGGAYNTGVVYSLTK